MKRLALLLVFCGMVAAPRATGQDRVGRSGGRLSQLRFFLAARSL